MKRPILRMTDTSLHPAPIVNRGDTRFVDLPAIGPCMAAMAPMLCLNDDRAACWAPCGVDNRVVVASAFGAFHGSLLAGLFD